MLAFQLFFALELRFEHRDFNVQRLRALPRAHAADQRADARRPRLSAARMTNHNAIPSFTTANSGIPSQMHHVIHAHVAVAAGGVLERVIGQPGDIHDAELSVPRAQRLSSEGLMKRS